MCEIVCKNTANGVDVTCSISGKPITISNEYGMFCEDMCQLEECKSGYEQTMAFISEFTGVTPREG